MPTGIIWINLICTENFNIQYSVSIKTPVESTVQRRYCLTNLAIYNNRIQFQESNIVLKYIEDILHYFSTIVQLNTILLYIAQNNTNDMKIENKKFMWILSFTTEFYINTKISPSK